MELQTVRQVSLDYDISNRMLRYYEQIGLIESSRIDGYAYRVYDEVNIKRLQQIIILRKLQIPVKQIKEILNNQDAVAVIEIFKHNISELDEQITALSTVKSILTQFVCELQEKTDINLNLSLLNNKTMLVVMSSLSFSENKIKERISMEELNKANKTLNDPAKTKVRIVYLPSMTVVSAGCAKSDPNSVGVERNHNTELIGDPYQRLSVNMRNVLKNFIDDVDLFNIKPDTRIFGCGNEGRNSDGIWCGDYDMWASIPDDLDVPAPLTKRKFFGGLYAACSSNPLTEEDIKKGDNLVDWESGQIFAEWRENNEEYDGDNGGISRPACNEYFNIYNRHSLNNSYSEEIGYSYTDILEPIKEVKKISKEQKQREVTLLSELEKLTPRSKPIEIDLTSMKKEIDRDDLITNYENQLMIIHGSNDHNHMVTQEKFVCPVKIELRTKISKSFLNIKYAHYCISLKYCEKNTISVHSDLYSDNKGLKKCGDVPLNEFVDVEWIVSKEGMMIKVNGELRHIGVDYGYVKAYEENPDLIISEAVSVGTMFACTMTVKSLRITEI